MKVTRKELLALAKLHTDAARKAERIGPNIVYARTFRLCALGLRAAARTAKRKTRT